MYSPAKFISGGYFLAKRVARPKDVWESLPETLLTLSNCFTEIAPDNWADPGYHYTDRERAEEFLKFGIPANAAPELVKLLGEEIGSQHTNAFPNFSVAEAFYRECGQKDEIAFVGIGLDPSLLPSIYSQRNDDANHGYGLLERLELRAPLHPNGESLGFEILGFEATKFHSWLCHNTPLEVFNRFRIRTNSAGFIDSLDDARHVTQYLKTTGAEPAIWSPWLVVRYGAGAVGGTG